MADAPPVNFTKKWTKKLGKEMHAHLNALLPPKESLKPEQLESWIALHSMIQASSKEEQSLSIELPPLNIQGFKGTEADTSSVRVILHHNAIYFNFINGVQFELPKNQAIRLHSLISTYLAKQLTT